MWETDVKRTKIPVSVLGATGTVGQKFVRLLADHPWFGIAGLAASEQSAGKTYAEAVRWRESVPIPEAVAKMVVQRAAPPLPGRIVFSAIEAELAGAIEGGLPRAQLRALIDQYAAEMLNRLGAAPGRSSSGVRTAPSSGRTPRALKTPEVTTAVCSTSGSSPIFTASAFPMNPPTASNTVPLPVTGHSAGSCGSR